MTKLIAKYTIWAATPNNGSQGVATSAISELQSLPVSVAHIPLNDEYSAACSGCESLETAQLKCLSSMTRMALDLVEQSPEEMSMCKIVQDCGLLCKAMQGAYSHKNYLTVSDMSRSTEIFGGESFHDELLQGQHLTPSAMTRRKRMKCMLESIMKLFDEFWERKESGQESKSPIHFKPNQYQILDEIHTGISAILQPSRD